MAVHNYWRINVTVNNGDSDFLMIHELEYRATAGGADQATGGTATASTQGAAGFEPDKAFDDDTNTMWSTSSGTTTGWLQYQFGTAVDVEEIAISVKADATATELAQLPNTFDIEWSDDGSAWTTQASIANISDWSAGETKVFDVRYTTAFLTAVGVQVLDAGGTNDAHVTGVGAQVLDAGGVPDARATGFGVQVLTLDSSDKVPRGVWPKLGKKAYKKLSTQEMD